MRSSCEKWYQVMLNSSLVPFRSSIHTPLSSTTFLQRLPLSSLSYFRTHVTGSCGGWNRECSPRGSWTWTLSTAGAALCGGYGTSRRRRLAGRNRPLRVGFEILQPIPLPGGSLISGCGWRCDLSTSCSSCLLQPSPPSIMDSPSRTKSTHSSLGWIWSEWLLIIINVTQNPKQAD